jgi:hypothetical protein
MHTINLPPFWDRYLPMETFVFSLIFFSILFFIVGYYFCTLLYQKKDNLIYENYHLLEKIEELQKRLNEIENNN